MNATASLRRRGYFLDPAADEDAGEEESPEGFAVRRRITRPLRPRAAAARPGAARPPSSRRQAPPGKARQPLLSRPRP